MDTGALFRRLHSATRRRKNGAAERWRLLKRAPAARPDRLRAIVDALAARGVVFPERWPSWNTCCLPVDCCPYCSCGGQSSAADAATAAELPRPPACSTAARPRDGQGGVAGVRGADGGRRGGRLPLRAAPAADAISVAAAAIAAWLDRVLRRRRRLVGGAATAATATGATAHPRPPARAKRACVVGGRGSLADGAPV